MLNKVAIDAIKKQIKDFEALRDLLLPLAPGQNIDPIFNKIEELYKELSKEFGIAGEVAETPTLTA